MRKRRHKRESIAVKSKPLRFQIEHPEYRYVITCWGWLGLKNFGRNKFWSYEDTIKATGAWRHRNPPRQSPRKWNHIKERSFFFFGFFFSWKSKEVGLGGGLY